MSTYYQFNVYNEHVNFLVTIPELSNELAEKYARKVAMAKYGFDSNKIQQLQSHFFLSFKKDSVIDLDVESTEEGFHYADLLEEEIMDGAGEKSIFYSLLNKELTTASSLVLFGLSVVVTFLVTYLLITFF